jgi:hypothetical protein
MLDTIDKLTEPTACSLLDGTMINVDLTLAKVFPFQKACHSVLVQSGYVVVQPTYMWSNAGHYPLPVPIDGGDIATLAEALVQRVQWPKDRILIRPMTRHRNPEAATGSRVTRARIKAPFNSKIIPLTTATPLPLRRSPLSTGKQVEDGRTLPDYNI